MLGTSLALAYFCNGRRRAVIVDALTVVVDSLIGAAESFSPKVWQLSFDVSALLPFGPLSCFYRQPHFRRSLTRLLRCEIKKSTRQSIATPYEYNDNGTSRKHVDRADQLGLRTVFLVGYMRITC